MFRSYPYLHLSAERGSGKTTLLELINNIAFNACIFTNMTIATLFRFIEANQPTLLIDEAESFNTRKGHSAILDLLRAGYKKSGQTTRNEKTESGWTPTAYSVYCPKIFAGISDLEGVLLDRTIVIRLYRKTSADKVKEIENTEEFEKRTDQIRQDCYLMALSYTEIFAEYIDFVQSYDVMPNFLINRRKELYEPLYALVNLIRAESECRSINIPIFDSLNEFALHESEEHKEDNRESNETHILLEMLFEIFENHVRPEKETEKGKYYSRNKIYNAYQEYYIDRFPNRFSQIQFVRFIRRKLGLVLQDHCHVKNDKQYLIPNGFLEKIMEGSTS